MESRQEYEKRIELYGSQSRNLSDRLNKVSNLRLVTALIGFGGAAYLLFDNKVLYSTSVFAAALVLFIYLVVRHDYLKRGKRKADILLKINEDSVRRLTKEWTSFADMGADFYDPEHDYSGDLDLFGKGSLFQLINTAVTYSGRLQLRDLLLTPSKHKNAIRERQEAAKELSGLLDWRQRFQAEALLTESSFVNPEPLYEWAEQVNTFYLSSVFNYIIKILPAVTVLALLSTFLFTFISFAIPAILIIVQIGLLALRFMETSRILGSIDSFADNIKIYRIMLELIEKQEFKSGKLKACQDNLRNKKDKAAYMQIAKLEKIMDMISIRRSQLYLVIDILLLWDYQCITALERWKHASGRNLKAWIDAIGSMEAISSLAVLYHDNPDWTIPVILDRQPGIFASGIGHPLLPADRVCNDIGMMRKGHVMLVTGSNMSGKSTLLRTAGINLVLAYAGAPVCAREFHCSVFDIYTSMRVRDDLERNISSFYAELLRIKRMIEAAKRGEPVFFLLDEIFKGTNSRDRHTGARVLIKQLSEAGAIGFVSTHDVELGDLSAENNNIKNYHFREYYREGQLYFDYKLHQGVSNTRNAIYLMKMAGIIMNEE